MKHATSQTKSKKRRKKRKRLWLIPLLFLLIAGAAYFYYVFEYRAAHEPETLTSHTTQETVHTLKSRRTLLSITPDVKNAAFNGRAAEIDYGTYIIPGLLATKTQVFGEKGTFDICTAMTPQGLAVTEDYLLVSSYCFTNTHNSVLYVIDKKSHALIKEIVLRNKSHVGGLAYDSIHQNIWLSGMSRGIPQVNAISLKQLEDYSFQEEYQPISYSQSYDLYAITRNSFLTYHNNALYVGYFTQDSASVLEEYAIMEDGTLATQTTDKLKHLVDARTPIALPTDTRVITEQAQGVAFYKDKILFSHSYGILPSKLRVFQDSFRKLLEKEEALMTFRFPEKLEQIYVDGDDLYVLFESAAYGHRSWSLTQMDRILKLDLNTLLE